MDITHPLKGRTIRQRPVRPRGRKRWLKLIIGFILAFAFLASLPALLSLGAYGYLEIVDIILPGVQIGGVGLEGLTLPEAALKLHDALNEGSEILAVDSMDLERIWIVSPSELGLQVDAEASAAQAHSVGRGSGVIAGIEQMVAGGWSGSPQVSFDPVVAETALQVWSTRLDVPVVEGHLEILNGEVVQRSGRAGKSLDVEASLRLISADPASALLEYKFVPFIMVPVEPIIGDVTSAAAEAERLLISSPTVRVFDPVTGEVFNWSPTRVEIAEWVSIHRGAHEYTVDFDESGLAEYVARLDASLGEERSFDVEKAYEMALGSMDGAQSESLQIRYHETEYVLESYETWISLGFKMGIPYWRLRDTNPNIAWRDPQIGESITLPPKDAMLTIPVVENKRIVISITEQHMWIYQDGELINDHVISTGMAGSPTMSGVFQIQSRFINAYASRWNLWMPHFLGIYEAAPGFLNGIHGLPLLSNGVRLWGSVLGQPASYGCIVLDLEAAEEVYNWAEDGVVVEIRD